MFHCRFGPALKRRAVFFNRMYEELQQLVQDIFHEGQYTLERVIDNVGMAEVEVVVGFKELLQAGHHEAVECR